MGEEYIVIDGQRWYKAWDICIALRLNYDRAKRLVRAEDKRTVVTRQRRFHDEKHLYFSRRGVEAAIAIKGGLPRARMLEALA